MNTDDHDVRKILLGREMIVLWMALLKATRLYESGHDAVHSAADRIRSTLRDLAESDADVVLAVRADSFFIDGIRVREGSVGSASYQRLMDVLGAAGIATLRIDPEVDTGQIETFARLLLEASEGGALPDELVREMAVKGVTHIEFDVAPDEPPEEKLDQKQVQKRIYLRSIGVIKALFYEARAKDRINLRRVKRVVQEMIESIDSNSDFAMFLTSVKNYDEYTFNHSVNVGVSAIALGRAVGLTRRQLYILGQAGMMHDLGKLCIPKEVLNKAGRLTPEERKVIQRHPVEGFVSIATKQGVSSDTIGVALGAYEHHLNLDGSGYPATAAGRPIGLLSRIVAIVDRYDAMTSARVYRSASISPPKALALLYHSQRDHLDQALLHTFLNLVGFYPLGTVVRLSDSSVGIVIGATPEHALRHFPVVTLLLSADGRSIQDETVDLAEHAKEQDPLQVQEVLNAAEFGIDVMEYIL